MEFAFLESAVPPNTLPISPVKEARGSICDAEMCMFNTVSCLSLEITENICVSLSFVAFAVFVVVKIFCNVEINGGEEASVALGFACCCCCCWCGASL